MTPTRVETIPAIGRAEAEVLASTEYVRLVEQLRSLGDDDWGKPTDCPLWDVRAIAGHSIGMMSDFTSLRSVLRRMRAASKAAKQAGGALIHAAMTPAQLIARAAQNGPTSSRWRARPHTLVRRIPIKQIVAGQPETWHIGYLLDTILTRDPWMHRVDIARATGRDLVLTPDHDGRIVAEVVAEWARRHRQPFTLILTGPAGGTYTSSPTTTAAVGDDITLDAVEFTRIVSGRAPGSGLLTQEVPF